ARSCCPESACRTVGDRCPSSALYRRTVVRHLLFSALRLAGPRLHDVLVHPIESPRYSCRSLSALFDLFLRLLRMRPAKPESVPKLSSLALERPAWYTASLP